jgi:hypothetical protein
MKGVLFAACMVCATAFSQQLPKTMTKMVVQLQGPDVPADSFAAKPKTMYRAGTQYCRIEEQDDPVQKIHGLTIVNEPDAWMVNLAAHSGKHIVDPGPTFNCRLPIFRDLVSVVPEDESKEIAALEFGLEQEFFKARGATAHPGGVQQGQQTTAYIVHIGESSLALFTYGTPERPLAVAWTRGDKNEIFWYSGYGQINFDPKLFAKPEGVKIEVAQ